MTVCNSPFSQVEKGLGDEGLFKHALQVGDDTREHVTNHRPKQREDDNDDDGDQNEDQRILNEALALFPRLIQHENLLPDKSDKAMHL